MKLGLNVKLDELEKKVNMVGLKEIFINFNIIYNIQPIKNNS